MDNAPAPTTSSAIVCVAYHQLPEPRFLSDVPNYVVRRIVEANVGRAWTLTTERFGLSVDSGQAKPTPTPELTYTIGADDCGRLRSWRSVTRNGTNQTWERTYQGQTVTEIGSEMPNSNARREYRFDASRRVTSLVIEAPMERGRWDYSYSDLPGAAVLQEGAWFPSGQTAPSRMYYRAFGPKGELMAQGESINRKGLADPDPMRWITSGTVYQLDQGGRTVGHVNVDGGRTLVTVRYKVNSEGAMEDSGLRRGYQLRYQCRRREALFCGEEDVDLYLEGPGSEPMSSRYVRRLRVE